MLLTLLHFTNTSKTYVVNKIFSSFLSATMRLGCILPKSTDLSITDLYPRELLIPSGPLSNSEQRKLWWKTVVDDGLHSPCSISKLHEENQDFLGAIELFAAQQNATAFTLNYLAS